MQLVRFSSFAKTNALSSVVRNASCSRGWLRLLVQSIFAAVTVTSFILIVLMTVPQFPPTKPALESVHQPRCKTNGCRVICKEAPYYDDYARDISVSLQEAEGNCNNVFLTLDSPMFTNNTLPSKWLSRLRTNIHELSIIRGNLMYIQPYAFMSQQMGGMQILSLNGLVIKTWKTESFVGLSTLRRFYINDCVLENIPKDLFKAVDDTLETLTITKSNQWNPINITGVTKFTKLSTVDFSSNSFTNVLGKNSFTGLQKCKVLYLNSCNIYAIGEGAFDNLNSIEIIYLNQNYLFTIPNGLFSNIISLSTHKPRINLQENLWHCTCDAKALRQLITNDMLLTDPVCDSPYAFRFKTFSEFGSECSKEDDTNSINYVKFNATNITDTLLKDHDDDDIFGFEYVINGCINMNQTSLSSPLKMVSPVREHACPPVDFHWKGFNRAPTYLESSKIYINFESTWLKFSYSLDTFRYSMIQIGAFGVENYALVWYQSTCPNELYCVSDVPSVFRIYNVDINARYVFCPITLDLRRIETDHCITYDRSMYELMEQYNKINILFYIATGAVCLIFGALCVYMIIRKYPNLLKGSKRILFVKHKTVDVLVLPPKIPLRNNLDNECTENCNENKIYIVPAEHVPPSKFKRNKSTRSSKSNTPSYISALQPTEDQLAEWRIRHHFNNDLSITSVRSDFSTLSWIHNDNAFHYSLDIDNERTYESLK